MKAIYFFSVDYDALVSSKVVLQTFIFGVEWIPFENFILAKTGGSLSTYMPPMIIFQKLCINKIAIF